MRQSPRLQGNHKDGAGNRSGPALPAPLTPHRPKSGAALAELLREINAKYQLGLRDRGERSPANNRTSADKAYSAIQYLFYHNPKGLHEALALLENVAAFLNPSARLELLHGKLRSLMPQSPRGPKIGTPATPRNQSLRNLKSPLSNQLSRSANIFHNYQTRQAELQPQPPTAFDPGSPTDEDEIDEDDYVAPPSPTTSALSAQRRAQASPRFALGHSARKRPSDSSNDSEKSPKLSKIEKGKQSAHKPPILESGKPLKAPVTSPSPLFKKPTREMAPSFYAAPTGASSVNTSFNNTVHSSQQTQADTTFTSFNHTVNSSQQTQADTANTSFASSCAGYLQHDESTRTSSTMMGSLGDDDLVSVGKKLELESYKQKERARILSQDQRESTSTFGSVDEDGLLDASYRVEDECTTAFTPLLRRPVDTNLKSENITMHRSPTKPSYFDRQPPETTTSFPAPTKTASLEKPIFRPRSSSVGVSPPQAEGSRVATLLDSPSRVSYHIANIPKQGLFVDDMPHNLTSAPYFLAFICQRIALKFSVSMQDLMHYVDISSCQSDPEKFWASIQAHPKISHIHQRESICLWPAWKRQNKEYTFKGQISLNLKQSGPVFNLQLSPVQADRSCRFQRKFGSDRFLYLQAPVLQTGSSRFNSADMQHIKEVWKTWLLTEHLFLGRRWRVFHVELIKKKSTGKKQDMLHDKRLVLFALDGCGIDEPFTVGEMLNWFLPFRHNENQTFLKTFARFDLGLSRTVPTQIFKPSQVRFVPDVFSNGEQEATQFNDPSLRWEPFPKDQAMNDGCSRMSLGAMKLVWDRYQKITETRGPLPSAFQGRIGGAKGLWMISAESYTKESTHTDIWIEISESQLKFNPHPEDMDRSDRYYDPLRLTFEVSNYSSAPIPSDLHISFIQIMADRGVPKSEIAKFMTDCLDAERTQLLDSLLTPARTYEWVYKNGTKARNTGDISWQASLPVSLEEKLKLLLESGFSPLDSSFLAKNIERFIQTRQLFQESKLRTPLPKSTFIYGVADPTGILKPGEVHVQFSSCFIDELTKEKYLCLRDMDILVARQPACRRSDMQKVRTVIRTELSHLVDLVVFPSRGEYPLAAKLQGGDYDGDIFWLCWEPKLVDPFKNAPAPVKSPDPSEYGIKQDSRKLKEVMDTSDVNAVNGLLEEAFEFRKMPSLLGLVTIFAEKQVYKENRMSSYVLEKLYDMHDLLVDASKQGYSFTLADFNHYVKRVLNISPPKQPAYKKAMEECLTTKEIGGGAKMREKKYNPDHVIDHLYFDIVKVHNIETMKQVHDRFSNAKEKDETLLYPYKNVNGKQSQVIKEELRLLNQSIDRIYRTWATGWHKDRTSEQYVALVNQCYEMFVDLMPVHTSDPEIRSWLEPSMNPNSSFWKYLKASVLYAKYPWSEKETFVFQMAGRNLAKIKAECDSDARTTVRDIQAILKPKPIKTPMELDKEEESGEDEFESALEQINP